MPRIALKIEAADGSRRDVPALLPDGSPNAVYNLTWASIEAGTAAGSAEVMAERGEPQHVVVLDAGALAAFTQRRATEAARLDEIRSRTFQVFRRAPNTHAKSPVEVPELVTLGDVGETFSPADIAQIRTDLGANRLEPLP